MKHPLSFALALALGALTLGMPACGGPGDARDLTLAEWEELSASDQSEAMASLDSAEAHHLMLGALKLGMMGDTTAAMRMTVREVIAVGRVAAERGE